MNGELVDTNDFEQFIVYVRELTVVKFVLNGGELFSLVFVANKLPAAIIAIA